MTETGAPRFRWWSRGTTKPLARLVADTMEGLRCQEFPLDRVKVILVGSPVQVEAWDGIMLAEPFLCL
jgi:hypothetical protein